MTTTTTIAVPTSCAALCTKLAELSQRIDDEFTQAGSGAAIDYGALEQRIADALGELERGLHAQVLACLERRHRQAFTAAQPRSMRISGHCGATA